MKSGVSFITSLLAFVALATVAESKQVCKSDGNCYWYPDENDYALDYSSLKPGQVQPITVKETGEEIMSYGHRVGLPANLTRDLLAFSNRMGITDTMKRLILDTPLEEDGEKRVTLNDGVWWIKRFPSYWHSNMHYITPDDDKAQLDFLKALGAAGFDTVLNGVGDYMDLDSLACYYMSFIAVSYCDGSYLHSDAEDSDGQAFNMLFPLMQFNDSGPELDIMSDDEWIVTGYKYEEDAAILLGDDGYHATAHCDYRKEKGMRLSASVYMADINEDTIDSVVWDETMDPPYPRQHERYEYLMGRAGNDWAYDDPTQKLPTKEQNSLSLGYRDSTIDTEESQN